jgi:hypothetical protein
MPGHNRHILLIEGLWILVTLLVIAIVLFPILDSAPAYPFFVQNALFIAAFITFSRYIFFLPISLIARRKWIKVAGILGSVILVFVLATALGDYRNYIDEVGLQTLVEELPVTRQTSLVSYMKNEMVFFGVGSIITAILLTFRLIVSLWRMRNSGRV